MDTSKVSTVNAIAFAINLVVVWGSEKGLLGKDNAQVSDEHPTLVTPAGWAFAIWGVIFTSELAFTMWQALTPGGKSDLVTKAVGPWFAIACVLQAAWSIAFSQELLLLSAILLVAIALALAVAVVRLTSYKRPILVMVQSMDAWIVHFPIGLHAGWTCAAALVNINVALDNQSESTKVAALILTVVVACLVATLAAIVHHDLVYLGAVVWALAGIAGKMEIRHDILSADVAQGVDEGLKGACGVLLFIGALTVVFWKGGKKRLT